MMGAMTIFKTILVGVDGRDTGRDALALAAQAQRAWGGDLIALHAYPHEYFVSAGSDSDVQPLMHGDAETRLKAELERAGVQARPVAVPDSSPGRALHLAAERENADLIVVGSSHRGRLGRVFAGDVTVGALHGAPCPVLVAPSAWATSGRELRRIGVGFDGSEQSRAAVELAHRLAIGAGASLRVVWVVSLPPAPTLHYERDWEQRRQALVEEAQKRVDELVAELGEGAEGEAVTGTPSQELAYEANQLDLLVTGSRDYGPVRLLMLGSTSSKLVHEAPSALLVLPRGAEEAVAPADASQSAAQTG
jgi:nucleotide-binding universal stress UspA family protein